MKLLLLVVRKWFSRTSVETRISSVEWVCLPIQFDIIHDSQESGFNAEAGSPELISLRTVVKRDGVPL